MINIDDLNNYEVITNIGFSYGRKVNKKLSVHCNITDKDVWFVVKDHDKEVYNGNILEEAVRIYNLIGD